MKLEDKKLSASDMLDAKKALIQGNLINHDTKKLLEESENKVGFPEQQNEEFNKELQSSTSLQEPLDSKPMKSSADFDPDKAEIGKDGVVSTDEPLNEFLLVKTPDPSIKWTPEDYEFTSPFAGVWYYKNLELRTLKRNYWLLRKKVKNERGNPEMLLKWRVQILPEDKDFADAMFSKGLK